MTHNKDVEQLRQVAIELSFDVQDPTIDECLKDAKDLFNSSIISEGSEIEAEPIGHKMEDEHNAFLYIYDRPRVEKSEGPLADVSVAVKDNIAVKNLPLTAGLRGLDYTPQYDATVVKRLLGGGASLVGKTNLDPCGFGPTGEFSEFGPVENPLDSSRITGGSSSGSAAAVAAGMVESSLGTDTGGSIRVPAACCGVVGIKPTHGLVPTHGLIGLAPSTDTVGPLSKNVTIASMTLQSIVNGGPETSPVSLSETGLSDFPKTNEECYDVGIPRHLLEASDESIQKVIHELIFKLESNGFDVTFLDLECDHLTDAFIIMMGAEFRWYLKQFGIIRGQGSDYVSPNKALFSELRNHLNKHIARRVLPGAYIDMATNGTAYQDARRTVSKFDDTLQSVFKDVDLLMMPTIRTFPLHRSERDDTEGLKDLAGNTIPFSLTGNPAISVPAGQANNFPISVQIVGPRFCDEKAIKMAHVIEKIEL